MSKVHKIEQLQSCTCTYREKYCFIQPFPPDSKTSRSQKELSTFLTHWLWLSEIKFNLEMSTQNTLETEAWSIIISNKKFIIFFILNQNNLKKIMELIWNLFSFHNSCFYFFSHIVIPDLHNTLFWRVTIMSKLTILSTWIYRYISLP